MPGTPSLRVLHGWARCPGEAGGGAREGRDGPAAGWGPAWPPGAQAAVFEPSSGVASGGLRCGAQRGARRRPRSPCAEKSRCRSVHPHVDVSVHGCMGGSLVNAPIPAPPTEAMDHLQGGGGLGDAAFAVACCHPVARCSTAPCRLCVSSSGPRCQKRRGFRKSLESREAP